MDTIYTNGEITKAINTLCKYGKFHINEWRELTKELSNIATALRNLGDQLSHVHNVDSAIDFDEAPIKNLLEHKLISDLEEDLLKIKIILKKLNDCNFDVKRKITAINNVTLNMDVNEDNPIIKGTPTTPPLERLMEAALNYWTYFQSHLRNISEKENFLNWLKFETIEAYINSMNIDFDVNDVMNFLAITQYVDNEKEIL